ncbi:hypothetical protein SAMN04490248_12344 [Salinihabitans flavidus]|uniref:Uncharacterized protein n=1 Tax=Salinihabitans flavidus TaxID=569882 RepID=A0A1H8V047_9RHOB|nr:DUF6525 family protein [Salinihabitans flavidus]SEP08188.1 hypothetical protein SAMN04490248_12344 [Salinihabitans flavidus]
MRTTRNGNRGATRLRLRRRKSDPMRDFDALPPHLRCWLAQAARPWSPASCLAIWRRCARGGCDVTEALARLDQIEAAMLARDAPPAAMASQSVEARA